MGIFTGLLAKGEKLVQDIILNNVNAGVSDTDLDKEVTDDLNDLWDAFAKDKGPAFTVAGGIIKLLTPSIASFAVSEMHTEITALRDSINKAQTPVTSFATESIQPTSEQLGTVSHPDPVEPVKEEEKPLPDEHPEIPLEERFGEEPKP